METAAERPKDSPGKSAPVTPVSGPESRKPAKPAQQSQLKKAPYKTVQLFYGTDRSDQGRAHGVGRYGTARGTFSYGICEVSIPRTHKTGQIESKSILRLEFRADPKKHIVVLDVEELEKDVFLRRLRQRVQQTSAAEAFVFVHGYNTSFIEAAQRTAQMAHDLEFKGAPIMYSWPSQGTLRGYTIDEANAAWSISNLKHFMSDVVRKTGAKKVHLIAHSMGNRVLTRAFMRLKAELGAKERKAITEVVLAAPDIDADVFLRDILPELTSGAARVTLYASSKDAALEASRRVHGNNRAGDIDALATIPPGIDVIDATTVQTSFIGHGFGNNISILTDIRALMVEGKNITERSNLKSVSAKNGIYWLFKKTGFSIKPRF